MENTRSTKTPGALLKVNCLIFAIAFLFIFENSSSQENPGNSSNLNCCGPCAKCTNTGGVQSPKYAHPTDVPLPVEMLSFIAGVDKNNVTLQWSIASEENNSVFNIERKSSSSPQWTIIGYVKSKGNSSTQSDYSYEDKKLATGRYGYRLKQVDFNGNFRYYELSGDVSVGIPLTYALHQNYPNPFNPLTKIEYDLPNDGIVSVKIFDVIGREMVTVVNEFKTAGYYSIEFNGSNLASGAYFYRIEAGSFTDIRKMILVK